MKAMELYNELTNYAEDTEGKFDVNNKLIKLVIFRCYEIADETAHYVNSMDEDMQVEWLLESGLSPQEIKDFVGNTGF